MIAYLKGKIKYKKNNFLILDVSGVGYKLYLNESLLADLKIESDYEFFIYQHVKEDALDLYAFKSFDDLEMFEMLLSISGVGPKSALGVSALTSAFDLKEAIARGDSGLLTKVSGIGKKTAERIVLELREKVGALDFSNINNQAKENISTSADEIDALMALGYSLLEAREVLKKVDPKIKDSGERIKIALRNLGK